MTQVLHQSFHPTPEPQWTHEYPHKSPVTCLQPQDSRSHDSLPEIRTPRVKAPMTPGEEGWEQNWTTPVHYQLALPFFSTTSATLGFKEMTGAEKA